MTHTKTSLLCAAVLVGLAFSAGAQQTQLTPSRDRITDEVIRAELRGQDLSCWCAPDLPCHADVLLELANAGEPS